MSSTLTQKDIDALVHGWAASSGGAAAHHDVVPINFLIPTRVSRERRTVLDSIHGRYALALQAYLSSRLRTPMDVTLHSTEQATFGEFLMSLAMPCAAFTFRLGDNNYGVVDLGSKVAFHLVDRMFGGSGDADPPERSLTTLEQTVVRGVADRAIALLRNAWQEHLPLAPELVGFESNPEMVQVVNREDHVLLTTYEVRSGAFTGFVVLCVPMASLERFLHDDTSVRVASSDAGKSREVIERHMRHAHVDVLVRIPAFRLPMRAISALAEGQTLLTGHPSEGPVEILVNGKLRYRGSMGQVSSHLAVKVEQFITPPGDEKPVREGRVQ